MRIPFLTAHWRNLLMVNYVVDPGILLPRVRAGTVLDLWQGQCPSVPYRSADKVTDVTGWGAGFPFSRAHRYYRWFYEYSGGKLTDWGRKITKAVYKFD